MAKSKATQELEEFLRWSRRYGEILRMNDWSISLLTLCPGNIERLKLADIVNFDKNAGSLFRCVEPKIVEKEANSKLVAEFERFDEWGDLIVAPTAHGACCEVFRNCLLKYDESLEDLSLKISQLEDWTDSNVGDGLSEAPLFKWDYLSRQRMSSQMSRERMLLSGMPDPQLVAPHGSPDQPGVTFRMSVIQGKLGIARSETLVGYFEKAGVRVPGQDRKGPKPPVPEKLVLKLLEWLADNSHSQRILKKARNAAALWLEDLRK